MTGHKVWTGHPTLSRPLTILGVERRWFMLACCFSLAIWNALNAFLLAVGLFAVLYVAGLLAWRNDPAMLQIIAAGQRARLRYDPGKPSKALVEIVG